MMASRAGGKLWSIEMLFFKKLICTKATTAILLAKRAMKKFYLPDY